MMDGWGWIDREWKDGEWMEGGWMDGQMRDEWMEEWIYGWMEAGRDGQLAG